MVPVPVVVIAIAIGAGIVGTAETADTVDVTPAVAVGIVADGIVAVGIVVVAVGIVDAAVVVGPALGSRQEKCTLLFADTLLPR